MLEIEWKSSVSCSSHIFRLDHNSRFKHYHSDGRRRNRPKASTVHGWLVKWRATFSGNERLRREGIREMREAKATRERKRQREAARNAKAGASPSPFRLWPISLGNKQRTSRAPNNLTRPAPPKRPSRTSTRRLPDPSPRSTPASSPRPSHTRRRTGERDPRSSRKASYDSRGDVVRLASKRRRLTAPS